MFVLTFENSLSFNLGEANRIPTWYEDANATVEVVKHLLYSRQAWYLLSS